MGDPGDRQPLTKKTGFFYGWIIVGVVFLIGFTEAGVFQNILSIFLKPMSLEFGWSRSTITGAIAVGSICGGLSSPFIGPILDKHGPRKLAFLGILALSLGLVALSLLSQAWQLYFFFGIGRMMAVGMLSLVISVSVSNWFIKKRGRAMGIAHLGSRIGSGVFPPFVQFLILGVGWRLAWGVLGVVVFILSAIPAILFLKRRPEDIGLLPDGEEARGEGDTPDTEDLSPPEPEPVWSRSQVMRSPSFWMLVIVTSFIRLSGAGFNFHIFPFLTDQGMSPKTAVLVLSIVAFASAGGSLLLGMLAERYSPKKLLAVSLVILSVLFVGVFGAVKNVPLIFALALAVGIVRGGLMPILPVIYAEYFGRSSIGTVLGLSGPFGFSANALGPIIGAVCFDLLGSYFVPFLIFSILLLIAGILSWVIPQPVMKTK